MWASDFPHWDGSPEAMQETKEAIAPLSPREQQLILGDNVAHIYNLS
jgi:predicted TIM-barrel fold metal-dependent hydrolase